MRLVTTVALCLALAVLAGCDGNGNGNGSGNGDASWGGPPEPAADGSVAVDGFAEYQDGVEEPWERSAELVAAEFLRLDEREAPTTSIAGTSEGEGGGPRTVVVTFDRLLDDSVRAERWTLELERDGDVYALTSATRAFRCHQGRGHEDFAPEPCV